MVAHAYLETSRQDALAASLSQVTTSHCVIFSATIKLYPGALRSLRSLT
jgi:hypothetical protein